MSLAGRLVGRLMPSLSARAARPAPGIVRRGMASYTEQMEKTGRPLSPHVTIYAFPTIALSSITVRATGILLTVGCVGVAGVSATSGPEATKAKVQAIADSGAAPLAKFAVSWPLAYHFCGACRHAVWDLKGYGFTNAMMLQSSYAVMGASLAIAFLATSVSLPADKKE
mmetsp:Transcript_28517/g.91345  ORF Transcript_28517/g.91345 Transcript_28517/m.91345 type:complete len:169 (+) Transcript_28517:60-566(+)